MGRVVASPPWLHPPPPAKIRTQQQYTLQDEVNGKLIQHSQGETVTTKPALRKRSSQAVPVTPKAGGRASRNKESVILALVLGIATVAVYFPVWHHPFVNYDDMVYVVNNPHIQSGLGWDTISWAFTSFYQFNWHPLTWLSHAMDVQVYQLQPGGHHVTNLILHLLNVLLLFWVLKRATGYAGRSAMVAALFALHPVNVESVAWVSERKNLLSMFFFLLALGAYRWYATAQPSVPLAHRTRSPRGAGATAKSGGSARRPALGRYLVVALLFAMSLMSKPMTVTFPFVLLLWDYWPLQRVALRASPFALGPGSSNEIASEKRIANSAWRFLVLEKLPLFAMCAVSAVVTVLAQKAGGAIASLQVYPFSIRLTNAIVAYVRYIGKALWPTRLAPIYPHPWHPLPMWQVIPALLLLLAITALVVAARSRRYLPVGWFWFLGTLVPMIGLVHVGNQAMADRYAYLPFIGCFIMVCWAVAKLAAQRRIPLNFLRAAAVIVLLALAIVTEHQLGYWNSSLSLWSHTLQVTTGNYVAHDNLAMLLLDRGQTDEAMKNFHAALAIDPSDPISNLQIARYDHQQGRWQEAIARYDHLISITPVGAVHSELLSNKGLVYLDMLDNLHAQQDLQAAVAMDPHNYRGWLGLGVVAARAGDLNLAIANFQRSIAAQPTEMNYSLLAQALDQAGRTAEAKTARQRARLLSKSAAGSPDLSGSLLAQ